MNQFPRITLALFFIFSLNIDAVSSANGTLETSHIIRDGDTLSSPGGLFELGFFSPGNSTYRYLGIWYKNIPERAYVWVANRESPLTNTSGVLRVTQPGILALFNHTNGSILWSSNATSSIRNPTARLFDSGNLVVKDANDDRPENFVWQSFDYPTDTYLPGMSIGWNFLTGVETYLTSWRSNDDPGRGEFISRLDPTGYPQIMLTKGGTVQYRLGPWNGVRLSGAPDTRNDRVYTLRLWINKNEVKYREDSLDPFVISRSIVSPTGDSPRLIWSSQAREWTRYRSMSADNCDSYNLCGPNGICNIGNSPPCECLDKFVSRDPAGWIGIARSNGCVRRMPLNCRDDVFLKYSGIKLPDSRNSTFDDQIIRLANCNAECSRNCSCTAYTQLNISGSGSGCLFYHGDLIDIRTLSTGQQDLYIRMAFSERANVEGSKGKKRVVLIASLTSVGGVGLVCLSLYLILNRKWKKDLKLEKEVAGTFRGIHVVKDAELPFFNLSTIIEATNNFSNSRKLGEGGFGPVYRGILEDGQEIAVKQLSMSSAQGVDELKNEVMLIAKLQHRNLVRTLGCCNEGEENILIYEYMPNKSLDLILFDQTKSTILDWGKRFNIINGIAKGLLYLHQDSRLRIIHRDLKASNILLDANLNPKISDFGLARSFGGNETEAQTRRVVGTYGYMSPEYAIDGLFSIKSDVFSFGVLVLEIVGGKRNRGFFLKEHNLNLLGHAWRLHEEGNSSKLVDPHLGDSFNLSQALRSIHVGLLCVQKSPEDRPNISSVVFMLENEVVLPKVKQPGFFNERDITDRNPTSTTTTNSENQVTISWLDGR